MPSLWNIWRFRWPKGRGLLVWADSAAAFDVLAPVLREFEQRFPRANIYLCSLPPIIKSLERRDCPGIRVPLAFRFKPLVRRLLRRTKTRALLVAWPDHKGAFLASIAADSHIPVLQFQCSRTSSAPQRQAALSGWRGVPSRAFVWDPALAASLRKAGMPSQDISVLDVDREITQTVARRAAEEIAPFVALNDQRGPRRRRPSAVLGRWLSRAQTGERSRWLVSLKYRKLHSLATLRAALGAPQTIVCLGNGPSSEDGRLVGLAHDALFRVNHGWASRELLTKPDVVFTGGIATLDTLQYPTIFAFQTSEAEERLLPKALFSRRRTDYFVADHIGAMDFAYFGSYAPTNGAVMLATAVALAPKRLVIAGMDLYQNPAGAYPGDARTPNAYSIGHDPELEARFILSLLSSFAGEVTIFGDALDRRWREERCKVQQR